MVVIGHLGLMSQMLIEVRLLLLLLLIVEVVLLLLLLVKVILRHQVFSNFRRFGRHGRIRTCLLLTLPEDADDDGEDQEEDEDGQADHQDEDRAGFQTPDGRDRFWKANEFMFKL